MHLPTLQKVLRTMSREIHLTDADCVLAREALNWLSSDPATRGDFTHKGTPYDAYGVLWAMIDVVQEHAEPEGSLTLA